ncbi:unnamed protein product, partial [Mesorhabditis spiculigera]
MALPDCAYLEVFPTKFEDYSSSESPSCSSQGSADSKRKNSLSSQEAEEQELSSPELKPDVSLMNFAAWPKKQAPEFCVVCGNKTAGFHYDVPSCNGCKTFFRRALLSQRKVLCKEGGGCLEKSLQEGKFPCRGCRFARCVEVGMNPAAIQTERKMQNQELYEKLAKQRRPREEEPDDVDEPPRDAKLLIALRIKENSFERMIDSLQYLEIKVDKLRYSTYNPMIFEIATEKLAPMPNWPLKDSDFPPLPKDFVPGTGKPPPRPPNHKFWLFFDLLLSIEYAKTFDFFMKLDPMDKLVLTRYVAMNLLALKQSYDTFLVNRDSRYVLHPDGTMPGRKPSGRKVDHLGPAGNEQYMDNIFVSNLEALRRTKMDQTEFVLVKAIVLCNSALDGLSDEGRKIIETAKLKYSEALFSAELAKNGSAHGPNRFQELLTLCELMVRNSKKHKEYHLLLMISRRPAFLSQFIEEIMDA